MTTEPRPQPLADVTIADHTTLGPGPYCTAALARLGARVIKLEPPGGDPCRRFPGLWAAFNAGKESVLCDLRTKEGGDLALAVAASADAIVTSWRPGVAARLGLGTEALALLNPRLVQCRISGYGHTNRLRDSPGNELTYLAASGALAGMFGNAASISVPGIPLGDTLGGAVAALRITAAILAVRTGGEVEQIELSIAGVLGELAEIGLAAADSPMGGAGTQPAYGIFVTSDGRDVALAVGIDEPGLGWHVLCDALGLDEFAELAAQERTERALEIRARLEGAVRMLTLEKLAAALGEGAIPWSPVAEGGGPAFRPGLPASVGAPPDIDQHGVAIRSEFLGAQPHRKT